MNDTQRLSLPPMPSGKAINDAHEAMAHTSRNECPFCWAPMDEEGFCSNKECR